MDIIPLLLGIFLILLGVFEGLWTTLWVDGNSAPFTSRLTTFIWNMFRKVFRRKNDHLLSLAGPTILFLTVFSWILFLWLGWTLLFFSDPDALKVKAGSYPPDFTDCLWYVAYCMFTIGNGDFSPKSDFWQVISSLVGFSGMGLVTLSITYLLQVISAVANKRAFSSQITSIGKTAEEFVRKQWTGNGFGAIELQLNSISGQLATLNEQHMAFPILHYYHAARPEKSQDIAIAILSDSLAIIELGIEEKFKPAETILSSTRQSVDSFLTTVKKAFIKPAQEVPKKPDMGPLTEKGIPLIPQEEFYKKFEIENEKRKLILGLINKGSWKWPGNNK